MTDNNTFVLALAPHPDDPDAEGRSGFDLTFQIFDKHVDFPFRIVVVQGLTASWIFELRALLESLGRRSFRIAEGYGRGTLAIRGEQVERDMYVYRVALASQCPSRFGGVHGAAYATEEQLTDLQHYLSPDYRRSQCPVN
jgi:hypothetical protein